MRAFRPSYAWSLPVTWQRWRSHHSIRRNRKPLTLCKPCGSLFYRTGVIADRSFFSHCGNRDFLAYIFCSWDLDLDLMTFIYELDLYSLEIYPMCENKICIRQGFRKLSSDRQTDRHDRNYIPRRFVGGQWCGTIVALQHIARFSTVTLHSKYRSWTPQCSELSLSRLQAVSRTYRGARSLSAI